MRGPSVAEKELIDNQRCNLLAVVLHVTSIRQDCKVLYWIMIKVARIQTNQQLLMERAPQGCRVCFLSLTGSPAGAGNTSVSCRSSFANFTYFTTATCSGSRFSILWIYIFFMWESCKLFYLGQLSIYSSKIQDSTKILSFKIWLTPCVLLWSHGMTM